MKELKRDLFDCIFDLDIDAICITTNGQYLKNGNAYMNEGYAKIAVNKWPKISQRLYQMLKKFGNNIPFVIGLLDKNGNYLEPTKECIKNKEFKCFIFSFPVMNKLIDGVNIQLIKQSATILKDYANQFHLKQIFLNRPEYRIDEINYYKEIQPILLPILDDRFTIVYN